MGFTSWARLECQETSSRDWPERERLCFACRVYLTLFLQDAAEYPETEGWAEEDGEEPLVVILQNALFFAPDGHDMSAVRICLKKIQLEQEGILKR